MKTKLEIEQKLSKEYPGYKITYDPKSIKNQMASRVFYFDEGQQIYSTAVSMSREVIWNDLNVAKLLEIDEEIRQLEIFRKNFENKEMFY